MLDQISNVREIERLMAPFLEAEQMQRLHAVLGFCLIEPESFSGEVAGGADNESLLSAFLSAKRLEGCSDRSISYYRSVLSRFIHSLHKPFAQVTTDDVRQYLSDYQKRPNVGKVTSDNIRRVISSLFSWLESEDLIYKSPVRRIRKIKSTRSVKPVISDEGMESLRTVCANERDLAMVDLLSSTGMRVGELVRLKREDIDFDGRECLVHGKGDKERKVYFDAKAKVHLQEYLNSRTDNNPALFVSLNKPYRQLEISGVETRLRLLGRQAKLPRIHPHKFRRTLATKAIDKGMPIEQVQVLLGHSKIDTTLCYAMVDQENVKMAHRKFIG